jgi:hypothetical protein
MMRAVVEGVDARASILEALIDVAVRLANEVFRVQTAGDTGLIGYDHYKKSGAVERAHRVDGVGKENEFVETIDEVAFFEEGAIAIEKDGAPHSRRATDW